MTRGDPPRIGFVGPGQMGEPMVHRLRDAGWPVLAVARRPDVRARLAASGAELGGTVREVAAGADVLVLCLFDDAQVREVALGPDGAAGHLRPGSVLVNHTTVTPGVVRDLVAALGEGRVVDAPVSGSASEIAEGRLRVLVGGDPAAVDRVTPVLGAYSDTILPTGGVGSATLVKLVNNLLFAAHAQIAEDALRLADQLDVDRERMLAALVVCSGGSNALRYAQASAATGGNRHGAVPYIRKDLASCRAAADELGIHLGFVGQVATTGPLPFA
jgi:3-hydroxyisobutyrate dehydrogenase-like beta-hydroxyacid dehydrogenase